jgi:colanic acid biosynthesis glycosyl transferase WcaI
MSRGRIIFVNRVYWPDESATAQLLHDLATGLGQRDREVLVVTSTAGGRARAETQAGVHIHRLPCRRRAGGGIVSRGWEYAQFWLRATGWLLRHVQPGDVVVALTDPPLLGVGAGVAARVKGACLVHWTHDLYPDVALALAEAGLVRAALRCLRPLRDASWRLSERVIVPGSDLARRVVPHGRRGPAVEVIRNWAPLGMTVPEENDPRPAWTGAAPFIVGYSGNFGRVHDFSGLLAAAAELRPRPEIQFVLTGAGARSSELERAVEKQRLSNVALKPPVSRRDLGSALSDTQLQVVCLRDSCAGTVWPSKFYGIVAAHRPILYLGPRQTELAQLIEQHELGACVSSGEPEAVVAFITGLVADPAWHARLVENVRRYQATLPRWSEIVASWESALGLVSPRSAGSPVL